MKKRLAEEKTKVNCRKRLKIQVRARFGQTTSLSAKVPLLTLKIVRVIINSVSFLLTLKKDERNVSIAKPTRRDVCFVTRLSRSFKDKYRKQTRPLPLTFVEYRFLRTEPF